MIREEIVRLYREELNGEPEPTGSITRESASMHWSREREYPWAIINGQFAPAMKVADCGCGGSPLLPFLGRRVGCECFGVDVNFKSRTGRHTLSGFVGEPADQYPDITWLQESMDAITLRDAYLDRIVCISTLGLVGESTARSTLGEMRRLLKPGGLALITVSEASSNRRLDVPAERIIDIAQDLGLALEGHTDWSRPQDIPGRHHVLGCVLKKPS